MRWRRLGVTPYRLAGRSPPPSRLRLTRICLRSGILPALVKYAGSTAGVTPRLSHSGSPRREPKGCRVAVSAESVGGHAQKKGVVEDYRRLIKTHELCTLNTTGFEHAYRRLRMRAVITCPAVRRLDVESPKPQSHAQAAQAGLGLFRMSARRYRPGHEAGGDIERGRGAVCLSGDGLWRPDAQRQRRGRKALPAGQL